MKKQVYKLGLVAFLGLSAMTFAQQDGKVGVNTESPFATLDVKPKTQSGNTLEGILIPEVTTQKAEDMGSNNQIQESTLVYIKTPTTASTQNYTAEVKTKGFYYFADGKWNKVGGGSATNSAVYRNARKDDGTSINISDTDFFIHLTNQNGGTINVPAATTANNGRELCFFNSGSKGFATGAEGNGASVQPSAGTCIISVAEQWVTKNSY